MPEQAMIEGSVAVCRNQLGPQGKLYLFTIVELSPPQELVDIRKLRWNIETDLRSLKRTVSSVPKCPS